MLTKYRPYRSISDVRWPIQMKKVGSDLLTSEYILPVPDRLMTGAVKADFRDFFIMYPHFLVGQRESLEQKTPGINELRSPLSNAYRTFKIGSVFLKLQSFKVGNKTNKPRIL